MLKYITDSLDGFEPTIAALYEPVDGKFRLNVEGAAPREKLDEFRNNNITLSKQLDAFKGVDPAKYTNLLAIEKKLTDKELVDAGKVDEVVATRVQTLKTEHDGAIKGLNGQLEQATRQLESLLIDSAVRVKALELGVLPTAVDDVMLRAKSSFKIIDGQAVPHQDGRPVYGKDGVKTMGVDEWIGALSKNAPHLFQANQGGGASGSRNAGRGAPGGKMTSMQKIQQGLSA